MSRLRVLGAAVFGGLLALMVPAVASAHATLESSVPSANSVLEQAPTSIELHFDEDVNSSLASIRLFDAKGQRVIIDPVRRGDSASALVAAVPSLANGLYAVVWKATSVDGHVVDGAFSFQVGAGATGVSSQDLLGQVLSGPAVQPSLAWAYGIARFISMIGAVLALGVVLWSLAGAAPLHVVPRFAMLRRWSWVLFGVGSLASLVFFAAQVNGGSIGDGFSGGAWSSALQVDTGRMLLLRVVAALLLGVVAARFGERAQSWWKAGLGVAGVATVLSFSASGHPNSLSPRALWVAIDAAHMAAIIVWLGGLFALWLAPKSWLAEPEAVRPANRFSFAASVCVPVIAVTGLLQTWKLAGGLDDVTATAWGRMLLAKTMLVVAMVALGAVSRWLLEHEGAEHLRRTVLTEAIIGVLVIGLAAGIVSQSPRPSLPSQSYSQQLASGGVIASVTISPGHVGSNEIHVIITPPGGSIAPVASLVGRVTLPTASIPASPITLKKEGPNHYSGSITFPRNGDWTLELIVGVTESSNVQVKGTVHIP